MAQGLLGLPPVVTGYLAGSGEARATGDQALQHAMGLLNIQNMAAQRAFQDQTQPLQLKLLEQQVTNAQNPADWKPQKRYNEQTGREEYVLVNLKNPSQVVPFGGQQAAHLSFQNLGGQTVGVDPFTGQPRTSPMQHTITPHQDWQQNTQFPITSGIDLANLQNSGIRTNFETGQGVTQPLRIMPSPTVGQVASPAPYQTPVYAPPGAGAGSGFAQPTPSPRTAPQPQSSNVPLVDSPLITPKEKQELRLKQPDQERGARNALTAIDVSLNQLGLVENSPGLANVTGPIAGRTWNLTGSATNAQALISSLKDQMAARALQAMRDASKTGGAVGQVTEKEWPKLENQLVALDQAQTTDQYRKRLTELRDTLESIRGNIADAYRGTYGNLSYQAPQFGRRQEDNPRGNIVPQNMTLNQFHGASGITAADMARRLGR